MATNPTVGQDLLDVPFPEMIEKMGLSIAQAQFSLDRVSIQLAQVMSGTDTEVPDPDNPGQMMTIPATRVRFNGQNLSMLELGFTPTFYQFVDTIIEVKVSISMSREEVERESSGSVSAGASLRGIPFLGGGARMNASSVSASYASKYQYTAEGASLLRTKLVTVPPPRVLEERIRAAMEAE
jgi:hypothetical protein